MVENQQSYFFEKLIGFIIIGMVSFVIALYGAGYVIVNYMIPSPSRNDVQSAQR